MSVFIQENVGTLAVIGMAYGIGPMIPAIAPFSRGWGPYQLALLYMGARAVAMMVSMGTFFGNLWFS